MKVWVTGAGGFLGHNLISSLARSNSHEIIGLYLSDPTETAQHVEKRIIDLGDFKALEQAMAADCPDWIFHLAGRMPPTGYDEMWGSNTRNTYHLLNVARTMKQPPRVVITGSAAEYLKNDTGIFSEESPIGGYSEYGISKSAQSMLALKMAENFPLDVTIARCFNIIGPGMSESLIVGKICALLQAGTDRIELGRTDSERDFLDVRDVADALICIMESDVRVPTVNVCSGTATRISDLVSLICEVYDAQPEVITDVVARTFDIDRAIGSSDILTEQIKWQPVISLRRSIEDIRKASNLRTAP